MLITLVNPPLYGAPTPPYGLVLLGTVAEGHGHQVRIVDFNVWKTFDWDRMVEAVLADTPDAVGLTCWGNATPFCLRLAESLRAVAPDLWLIAGGPMIRSGWHCLPRLQAAFDILVEGEGEEVLPHILADIAGRKRDGSPGRLVRAETPDIGILPLPRWGLLGDLARYRNEAGGLQLPVQASRGCAYQCAFCSVREFWGPVRRRDPAAVTAEIESDIRRYGADTILFYDDNFTADAIWIRTLIDRFRRVLPPFRWVASTRVDQVPPDLVLDMAEAGAINLFFGIESASERIRRLYRKNFRVDVLDVLHRVAKTGIAAEVSLIFGSPADGPDVLAANLDFMDACRSAGVSYLHTHVLFPIPGTPLTRQYADRIIDNPYPRVTQASLAQTPDSYFRFLEENRRDCLDFWMFRPQNMSIDQFFEGFFEAAFRKNRFDQRSSGVPFRPIPQAGEGMADRG